MDENKKKVLIIIGIIIGIISLIAIILSYSLKERTPSNNPSEKPNSSETYGKFNTEITLLNDYDEFFTVNNMINTFYESITNQNKKVAYQLLDKDYITANNITTNNIFAKIKSDYDSPIFTTMEIYYNVNSTITYYFVKGFIEDIDHNTEITTYSKNICFIVIANKSTKHYSIIPLGNIEDIHSLAKSYKLKEKNLEYNSYQSENTKTENILTTYLSTFKDLMFLDSGLAYDMLNEKLKNEYSSKEEFYKNRERIYNSISSRIFSYSSKMVNKKRVYTIIDNNQNKITIEEESIMNFTIDFEI